MFTHINTRTHCRGGRGTRTQLPMQWLAVGKSTGPTTTSFCPLYLSRSLCVSLSPSPSPCLSLSLSLSPSLSTLPLSLYFSCTSLFLPYLSLFLLQLSLFQCDLSRARALEYTFFPFPLPLMLFLFLFLVSFFCRGLFSSLRSLFCLLSRGTLSRAHALAMPYIHMHSHTCMHILKNTCIHLALFWGVFCGSNLARIDPAKEPRRDLATELWEAQWLSKHTFEASDFSQPCGQIS